MSDAWSYLPGTGDAWERMDGVTGDAYNRLPGATGDSWVRLTTSSEQDVYVNTSLLQGITSSLAPWPEGSAEKDVSLLLSNSGLFNIQVENETAILPNTLIAEMLLKAYSEIQLGFGSVITLGFINGKDVLLLPPDPPWSPETDPESGDVNVGIDRALSLLEADSNPGTPTIETGPLLATLQIGSSQHSIAVYGDSIYSWALGMKATPLYPSVDARKAVFVDISHIEGLSTVFSPFPDTWLRNDLPSIPVETTPFPCLIDTDCAVPQQMISSKSYGFMCLIQEGCGVDLTTLEINSIIVSATIET